MRKIKIKKISKFFIWLVIAEAIFVFVSSLFVTDWPNSCTPDLLHPFGRFNPEILCAQVITPTLLPIFFLSIDLLILTLIIYPISLLIQKLEKKK
jgi:hypothetical protein